MTVQIQKVTVAGAGTMGPGIAATFAGHGFETRLTDIQPSALDKARNTVDMVFDVLVREDFLTSARADAGRERLQIVSNMDDALEGAEFLVETIPEKLEVKQSFYREIEPKVGPGVILASNTSGIPISQLGAVAENPSRIVGMHWSNPPHIIPVIEVIRGEKTSDLTVAITHQVVNDMEMIPVDVDRDVPGFVENRILYAIMREALHLVEEGVASAEAVDEIVKWGVGYKLAAIPPLQLLDVAGLDIYNSVAGYLNASLSTEQGVSSAITERVERGDLGIKTGRGLFDYGPDEIPELMQRRMRTLLDVKKALLGDM